MKTETFIFDDFFASNMEESISPFLTPNSRKFSHNLSLQAALLATFFWLIALVLSLINTTPNLVSLFLLFTFFLVGTNALLESLKDLFALRIQIDVLMTLSAFLSVAIGSAREGALLLVLFALSGALEEKVNKKANSSIRSLKQLAPQKVTKIEDGLLKIVSIRAIKPKDIIFVPAGQTIPLDGKVIEGESSVSLAHLTGEGHSIFVTRDSEVFAGSGNLSAPLTIEVTRKSADSTIERIIQMVMQAHQMKPKFQKIIDSFTSTYAKLIITLCLLLAVFAPFLFSIPYTGSNGSIYRAIALLIAASPCALVIAIPITYLSAISSLAKNGILLKGGTILDQLTKVDTIAFDKTGTLTKGELILKKVEACNNGNVREAIAIARALEQGMMHPIAEAICAYADKEKIDAAVLENIRPKPGFGIEGIFQKGAVFLGSSRFLLPLIAESAKEEVKKKLDVLIEKGEMVALLLVKQSLFFFCFEDEMRVESKKTIDQLRTLFQCKLIMLTGDHQVSAKKVQEALGLDAYYYELKPEDKLAHIDQFCEKGHLAMVGDGINDAPALARADVGISMGKKGAKSAIDAADVVLLQDKIHKIVELMQKAKATIWIVRQNIFLALCSIIIASTLAFFGWIPLWLAVVLHEGATVIVALNALRLLKTSPSR